MDEHRLSFFAEEIQLIEDPDIRRLVNGILQCTPRHFWEIPASATGKYHPPDENQPGGQIIHTKRAVYLADQLCRMDDIRGLNRDKVLAAMIVHNIFVRGVGDEPEEKTDPEHPLHVRKYTQHLRNSPHYSEIMILVEGHMGRWSPCQEIKPRTRLARLVHIADYVSSRREVFIYTSGIRRVLKDFESREGETASVRLEEEGEGERWVLCARSSSLRTSEEEFCQP